MSLVPVRPVLRAILDEPAPTLPPRDRDGRRSGAVWWALMGGLAVVEVFARDDLAERWFSLAVVVALGTALPWRRVHPLVAALVAGGGNVAALAVTGGDAPRMYASVVMLAVPFSLARWASGRHLLAGGGFLLATSIAAPLIQGGGTPEVVGAVAVLSACLALGAAARYRLRARQRDRERLLAQERERIARDLHDTVAHHVSAIAVRAQAGLAVGGDAAVEALRLIETEARRALTEMRGVVRALREDDPLAPPTGLTEALDDVATRFPGVSVSVDGDPAAAPATVQAAAARIVQESLTNAARHARTTDGSAVPVSVRVSVVDGAARSGVLAVDVVDSGRPTRAADPDGPGLGLRGMAERARLLGGELRAGPAEGGGWRVEASLPWRGTP
ncbi:MAG: histidine kinase [Kineosporiaceae bacterium]